MVNKIKAIFAAIGSIGVLMFVVSAFLWIFTNYPGPAIEFFIVSWFAYCGYRAYKYFLGRFDKESDNEQINS
jgi:hypothetical protein